MKLFTKTLIAITLSTGAAQAITVTPTYVRASASVDGTTTTNEGLPSTYAEQRNTSEYPFEATAYQSETGFSRIALDLTSTEVDGASADGIPGHIATAETALVLDFFNDSVSAEYGSFNFSLSGLQLRTFNAGGPETTAKLDFAAVAYSSHTPTMDEFTASMTMTGEYNAPEISHADGFSGSVARQECSYGVCYVGVVDIASINHTLNLGLIEAGQTVSVAVLLSGETKFDGYEVGAEVFATDPSKGGSAFTYSYSSTPAGPTPSPVPLPASVLFSLAGLASLAGFKRRKS